MINVYFHLITGTMAEQDLVALVKRLEAVALKLESAGGGAGGAGKSLLFYTCYYFLRFSSPGARTAAARVAFLCRLSGVRGRLQFRVCNMVPKNTRKNPLPKIWVRVGPGFI